MTEQDRVPDADFGVLDDLARGFAARGGQPGLAYGIVAGGALAHSGGRGERWLGGPVPDSGTVFRIASMTKSFTAATVLLLRDEGALRLDDPARDYVPELSRLRLPTTDSPPPTLRQLLTMTAGFPTDDPWGDRQQGLPAADFTRLVRDGVALGWAPGTRFEYSNLGYAILGQVIEAVTGGPYEAAVRSRILGPLGLTRTGFEVTQFDRGELARGYQRGSGGWAELVPDPYGAFAPMGGIFSCVADLARWVSGFADAFPPRDGEDRAHPLSRATRRELQLPQIAGLMRTPGFYPGAAVVSYGYGLFVEEDPVAGTVIQHSGGYPGFGSQMRWHLASGLGVVVLGNGTYAAVGELAGTMLAELLRQAGPDPTRPGTRRPAAVVGPAPGDGAPWPQTLAAQVQVSELLQDWDDELATRIFTPNVAWDQPFADRWQVIATIRDRIGDFGPDQARPAEFDSPAHCRWWLRGERGCVQAEIRLAPLRQPRVQWLRLAVPPAPGSSLLEVLEELIGLLNQESAPWPSGLPAAPSVDIAALQRRLRVAAAWAGRCELSAFRAGDGAVSVTADLDGETGRVVLAILTDPAGRILQKADLALLP